MLSSIILAVAAVQGAPQVVTREVADAYVEAVKVRDWEVLTESLSKDRFHFTDRAANQWGGNALDVGDADRFINLQRSWGLPSLDWDIETAFAVGEWAIYFGPARVPGTPGVSQFLMALHVEDGKITERHDIGNYLSAAGTVQRFAEESRRTDDIAGRYIASYEEEDWETMRSLLAENATFADPTAHVFGPQAGQLQEGRDAIVSNFERAIGPIENLRFHAETEFSAKNHHVIVGEVTYEMAGSAVNIDRDTVSFSHAFIGVVEVVDGKVTWHRDYADYTNFREQLQNQR